MKSRTKENTKRLLEEEKEIEEDSIKERRKRRKKIEKQEETIENLFDEDDVKEKKVKKTKKRKIKKGVYILILFLLLGIGFGVYYKLDKDKKEEIRLNNEKKLNEIKSHYSEIVKVNKKTSLYELKNDKYEEVGSIYPEAIINLDDININLDTKYFKIKDKDYYLSYESLEKEDKEEQIDLRYQKYIPFNLNIVTKNDFTMYYNDKELYTFKESMEFPVIINNYENKYYVEYENRLVAIKKDDVKETVKSDNSKKKNQSKITTFCYHRVYDTDDKCKDGYICLKKSSFDQQMKYLSDNNYITLTLTELYLYLTGKIQVEKATVITFDDGYLYKAANEVLEKYHLNGTMFVISSFFDDLTKFQNLSSIDIQSHTHNMHRNYVCPGGYQGGAILCASEAKIKEDLETSLEKLGIEPIGLAFPFYDSNDKAIKVLKEVGFKLAFIGRAGQMGKSTPNKTNLYQIPRMTVWDSNLMSFNTWKSYL